MASVAVLKKIFKPKSMVKVSKIKSNKHDMYMYVKKFLYEHTAYVFIKLELM